MPSIKGGISRWDNVNLVVGVLRSYNDPDVIKAVDRASKANLGKLFVVVNAIVDNGATRAWLKKLGTLSQNGWRLLSF